MPMIVCSGADLQCSFGTDSATFTASSQNVSAADAAGVVTDTDPENIPPFGDCTSISNPEVASATSANNGVLTPQPCQPVITGPWTPGSASVTIAQTPALDDSSTCTCSWEGVITVSSAGQGKAQAGAG
jgi:hypothetical protein